MPDFKGTPTRNGDWTWFKTMVQQKTLKPQYDEDSTTYTIYGWDTPEVLYCTIWKGEVPATVQPTYNQTQNDADKADFEANYKPYANRSIDDIPSLLITNSIKVRGGGNANLAVDGSVTPVVFEYNPPNNYDIEVTALSFLFEDSGAFAFGNRFIINAISTLANGLLLEVKTFDQTVSWQNMRRTRDLIEICENFDIVTGTTNFFRARIHLPQNLRLVRSGIYGSPDYLRVTVRDNLTSLDFAEAYFQGMKL